ncbi:MAG TPA: hypothetical protein IAC50_02070 [Candidatus Copromorpha excrementigallinarum]|uniref:DUF2383 domain-containing protein n=1 Tax=Candidatus Allocopromorpha excrementigallinarum TaxID=2840742 RepID=A0A9D1I1L0_9FIRM|nr:hypothetical protein [Candidatus Copromorpha excrementigallinarum]
MFNHDTAQLLRETDKGVKMAILSFDQLLEKVEDPAMRKIMEESRNDHKRLQNETQNLIKAYCVNKEQPPVMARVMARMETGIKLAAEDRDRAIAQITVKGCDTGKRSLHKYINMYPSADPAAADTAKKFIRLEEDLEKKMELYL